MLRSAEEDLTTKHAGSHDHRGPAPQPIEDKLVLDAAGEPQAQLALDEGDDLLPLLAVPAQPAQPIASELAIVSKAVPATPLSAPSTPRTRRQKQLADQPASAAAPKQPKKDIMLPAQGQQPLISTDVPAG